MRTTYMIINKNLGKLLVRYRALDVGTIISEARSASSMIVIKSDEAGDRIVSFEGINAKSAMSVMERAEES